MPRRLALVLGLALAGQLAAPLVPPLAREAWACVVFQPREKFAARVEGVLRGTVLDYRPLHIITPRTEDPVDWASGGVVTMRVDNVVSGEGMPEPGRTVELPFSGTTFGDPMTLADFLRIHGERIEVGVQTGSVEDGGRSLSIVRPMCSDAFIDRVED